MLTFKDAEGYFDQVQNGINPSVLPTELPAGTYLIRVDCALILIIRWSLASQTFSVYFLAIRKDLSSFLQTGDAMTYNPTCHQPSGNLLILKFRILPKQLAHG